MYTKKNQSVFSTEKIFKEGIIVEINKENQLLTYDKLVPKVLTRLNDTSNEPSVDHDGCEQAVGCTKSNCIQPSYDQTSFFQLDTAQELVDCKHSLSFDLNSSKTATQMNCK